MYVWSGKFIVNYSKLIRNFIMIVFEIMGVIQAKAIILWTNIS